MSVDVPPSPATPAGSSQALLTAGHSVPNLPRSLAGDAMKTASFGSPTKLPPGTTKHTVFSLHFAIPMVTLA